ncbi:RrF2 family transcriptional regulator [Chryseobacterium sp. CT-SW4]|uniref:RrF2 family transcriptional regulator n=1 Tax=Chryseobacterium sp. SW-1 TaxID=3157343 RepID=UPI003B01D14F
MLIFSQTCQYAIKACMILALEKRKIGINEISKQIGTPAPFTSKILQELTRNGLISSVKGRGGGFYLSEEQFETLTIKDIFDHFEDKDFLTACLLGLQKCTGVNPCPIHHIAAEIKAKVLVMFEYKIKDLKDFGSVII